MTAIEVALLLIGVVFILGSFFVMEKLSPTELSRVAELSEEELRIIMDRELETAGAKISDMADQAVDLSMNQIQRKMEKDTNEKIMAISEYSDTVIESINKSHNEIMFLYSMLNDKHGELTELAAELEHQKSEWIQEVSRIQESVQSQLEEVPEPKILPEQPELSFNHNEDILSMYQSGKEPVDIAKELGLGIGEVRLVIELFKGEQES